MQPSKVKCVKENLESMINESLMVDKGEKTLLTEGSKSMNNSTDRTSTSHLATSPVLVATS